MVVEKRCNNKSPLLLQIASKRKASRRSVNSIYSCIVMWNGGKNDADKLEQWFSNFFAMEPFYIICNIIPI